jgi:hypothetical protein
MVLRHVQVQVLGLLISSLALTPLAAQQPASLTADDYARAERFLGQQTMPLVSGIAGPVSWLPDGRLWYRATRPGGAEFVMADPARGTRQAAFDHPRLAQALGSVTGGQIDPARLPFGSFDLSRDGREITVTVAERRWTCDLTAYTCTAADTVRAPGALQPAPPSSVTSPDGRLAAFIRDHNLWVRDLATSQDRQLTTDGIEDFGYATNNAGWTRSPTPLLAWSPDSRRIFTFQQDARGVGNMYLVTTNVGTPSCSSGATRCRRTPCPSASTASSSTWSRRGCAAADAAGPAALHDLRPHRHRQPAPRRGVVSRRLARRLRLHVARCAGGRLPRGEREHRRGAHPLHGDARPTQFQSGWVAHRRENWRVLPASNEVLWWSQRDNWGHLYLYDLRTGALQRQITSGSWNVADVVHVDERGA